MKSLDVADIMRLRRTSRDLHAVVQAYPWGREDYPSKILHAPAPAAGVVGPQRAGAFLALIRERKAYGYLPRGSLYCYDRYHSRSPSPFQQLALDGKAQRALALLPDRPGRPMRQDWESIVELLIASGQPGEARRLSLEVQGFGQLLGAVASGCESEIRSLAPRLWLDQNEDCTRLAVAFCESRLRTRELGLTTLLDVFAGDAGFGAGYVNNLCGNIFNLALLPRSTLSTIKTLPFSKTCLRLLWRGLRRPTFEQLESLLNRPPEDYKFVLDHDGHAEPDRGRLSAPTLTTEKCRRSLHKMNSGPLAHGRDGNAGHTGALLRDAVVELFIRQHLSGAARASDQGQSHALLTLLANHRQGSRDAKCAVLRNLTKMLRLWRHAAGDTQVSELMTALLCRGLLVNVAPDVADVSIAISFAHAGGSLRLSQLINSLPIQLSRAGGTTPGDESATSLAAPQQDKLVRIVKDLARHGALAPFAAPDDEMLRVRLSIADHESPLIRQLRRIAGDPRATTATP